MLPCCRSAWPTTTCMCFARASPPSMRTWRSAGVLLPWLRWGEMFTVAFRLCWRCARGCGRGRWELLPLVCMWFSRQALLLGSSDPLYSSLVCSCTLVRFFFLPCRSVVEGSTRTVSTMQVGRQSALVEMAVCRLPSAHCVPFGRDPHSTPLLRANASPNCRLISAVLLSAGQDGVACGAEGCRSVHPCIHPLRACRHSHPHHLPCLGLRGGWAGVWLLG